MKKCIKCGRDIADDVTVCPYCTASQNPVPYRTYGSNGFAIAGFILSFLGGLLGLIFSIVGCVKAPQYGGNGKGLAVAGITISCIWVGIILFLFAFTL